MARDHASGEKPSAHRIRKEVLLRLTQPLTATQLSRKLGFSLDQCSCALHRLVSQKLARCLNPTANRNRLFWLTSLGRQAQRALLGATPCVHDFPLIDWALYSSVCFRHRSEVIRTLTKPMQPVEIKRKAAFLKPGLRMSANNVRDVIRYLKSCGIVSPVSLKKRAHPGYELTKIGAIIRRLLFQAEALT